MSERTCTIDTCDRPHLARGWCGPHYKRWKRYGDPLVGPPDRRKVCTVQDCGRWRAGHGWCKFHYQRWVKYGDPLREPPTAPEFCLVDGCEGRHKALGMCKLHYGRWRRRGTPLWTPANADACSTAGCDRQAKGQGLCEKHWMKRYRSRMRAGAYAEARCSWRDGTGCKAPADNGYRFCSTHRTAARERYQRRVRKTYEQSYLARGLSACWMCGGGFSADNPMHGDHLIPRSLGGPDDVWNLAPACQHCNVTRHNKPLLETISRHYPHGIPDGPVAQAVAIALANHTLLLKGAMRQED